jgi:hypothetical protein
MDGFRALLEAAGVRIVRTPVEAPNANHQGLGNALIAPAPRAVGGARIRCRERLGGLLRHYYQAA